MFNKNNRFEGLGMVKYSKFTPSTNPAGNDGKPWNNARLHFVLITNRTNSKKLAQEGKQSADFISCSAQGTTAESINQYFPDGSMIYVYGHLESYSKEENGVKTYGMTVKIDDYQASYNLLSRQQISALYQKNAEREAQKGQTGQTNPNPYGNGNTAYQNQNPGNTVNNGYVAPNMNQQNNVTNINTNQFQNGGYPNQGGMTYNPGYNAPMAGNPGYVQPSPVQNNGTGNGTVTSAIPGYNAPAASANPSGMSSPNNMNGAPTGAPNNMQFGEINGNLVISDDDLPF